MKWSAFVALGLFVASLSLAAATEVAKVDPDSFREHRARIEAALKTDAYSELTRTQRLEVLAALDRMERVLSEVTSVQELSDARKAQLFNDQEMVRTVLTKAADDSRMLCRTEQRTGSHRLHSHCSTVGERRRERENSQRMLGQWAGPPPMPIPGQE